MCFDCLTCAILDLTVLYVPHLQLDESNPILTEISDAMTAHARR